jgi:tRNA uracil 4-sulfurtransferase
MVCICNLKMEYTYLIIRYGELFLKGKNRGYFENKLISNIKKITSINVKKTQARLLSSYNSEHSKLKRVFGLISYSPAIFVNKDEIKEKSLLFVKEKVGKFKVETKRSDKRYPMKSPDISRMIGEYIEDNSSLTFDINSSYVLHIEINQEGVFIFDTTYPCLGGLPTSVEGTVSVVLENEASLLAGILMMKRGCNLNIIGDGDISLLQKFSPSTLKENDKGIKVVGDTFETLKKYSSMVLRPLIAYSKKEIKEKLFNYQQI